MTAGAQEKHLLFFLYFDSFCSWFRIFFSSLLFFLLLWLLFHSCYLIEAFENFFGLFLITFLISFVYFHFYFGFLCFRGSFFLYFLLLFFSCCSYSLIYTDLFNILLFNFVFLFFFFYFSCLFYFPCFIPYLALCLCLFFSVLCFN